jgi:hypothetical protein
MERRGGPSSPAKVFLDLTILAEKKREAGRLCVNASTMLWGYMGEKEKNKERI